ASLFAIPVVTSMATSTYSHESSSPRGRIADAQEQLSRGSTAATNSMNRKKHKEQKYKRPTAFDMMIIMLSAMAGALLFAAVLMAINACVYALLMIANIRRRFGASWKDHLAAPTNLSLSKVCLKIIWQGQWFSQYGAMIAWQDLI